MISCTGVNWGKLAVAFDFLHRKSLRDAQVGRDPTSPTLADCWTIVCYEVTHVGMEPLIHPALAFPPTRSQFKAEFSLLETLL